MIDWSGPASCQSSGGTCFCEVPHAWGLDQPSNTLSAIGFLLVGLWIIGRRPKSGLAWVYGLALLLVGVGTAYYHAHLTFLGQTVDFGGMNLVILIAPFYYLAQYRPRLRTWAWLGYVVALLASLAMLVFLPALRRPVFALLVAVILALYLGDPGRLVSGIAKRWLYWGLGIFLFGFIFWNIDTYAWFCWPTSFLQGHALWHLTSALSAYCLYQVIASTDRAARIKPA